MTLPFDPIAEARRHWERNWGTAPAPAMAAVTSIMRAQQILLARLNEVLKPFDLTFPRYEALMLLRFSRTGALPLGKMGERLQVHRTSVTNIIDRLEASGYARRVAHETDRRTVLATLTDAGRAAAERATLAMHQAGFAMDALDTDELESLFALLERLRLEAGDFRVD